MNKTAAFLALAAVGVIVLAGMIVLAVNDGTSAAAERFARDALTILGLLGVAGGLVYQQSKTGDAVQQVQEVAEQVRAQTNGTLTKLLQRNADLTAELAGAREQLAAQTNEVPAETLATSSVPIYTPEHAEDETMSP